MQPLDPSLRRADRHLLAVLAALPAGVDVAVVRHGGGWVVGIEPDQITRGDGGDAFDGLDGMTAGWWAGFLSYDLGRAVESVTPRLIDDLALPDMLLARFDARLVVSDAGLAVTGGTAGSRRRLTAVCRQAGRAGPEPGDDDRALLDWSSNMSRAGYEAAVAAAKELIAAGDCYQVNLARRLHCAAPADPVALFARLVRQHPAPHAALVRIGEVAVVSASPERFLLRRGDQVTTTPIKGTSADPAVLLRSAKDRAENVMIVDLARNDLGRVCRPGTVRVPDLCRVEAHPGLHHLVSTVEGTLRPGIGTGTLLRATFPPASVTGAPKPRVLQAIEDLERCRRGVYCGAVGWIDADRGSLDLNVAIRTFVVSPAGTYLGVGAGIVADSDPAAEWRETELKAARLVAAAGGEHAEVEWPTPSAITG